jgi:2-amino-4-hydroxy-6-hydroxymethyldihydropteridine diphosphokinase
MQYDAWAPTYRAIQEEFRYPFDREIASARLLRSLLRPSDLVDPLDRIANRLRGRIAIVVGLAEGAGAPPLWTLPASAAAPAVVAADGATEPCLAAGIVPDVIVTDLDGPVASEVAANARGALAVVHAHGDNRSALARWVPEFSGELAGSWAGAPEQGLLDVGGFTDGDRAAYLAEHCGASSLLLWGFDFAPTRERGSLLSLTKLAKLRWAGRCVDRLAREGHCPIDEWRRDGSRRRYGTAAMGPSTQ